MSFTFLDTYTPIEHSSVEKLLTLHLRKLHLQLSLWIIIYENIYSTDHWLKGFETPYLIVAPLSGSLPHKY
jgi:hypothetical protein